MSLADLFTPTPTEMQPVGQTWPICFDHWKQHPYTKVLEESIANDYVPKADVLYAQRCVNTEGDIETQVCEDIRQRQQKGILKYGTSVANNPLELRAWLQHAYEETLDNAIYLKRAMAALND